MATAFLLETKCSGSGIFNNQVFHPSECKNILLELCNTIILLHFPHFVSLCLTRCIHIALKTHTDVATRALKRGMRERGMGGMRDEPLRAADAASGVAAGSPLTWR